MDPTPTERTQTMIAVQTASPATMRYRTWSRHRSLARAVGVAEKAQVEGSVVVRVVLDADTARALAASGEICQTAAGEWMDAGQRIALEVRS